MNHFEFIDPADTLPRHLASVGLDLNADRVRLFARLWRRDAGSAAASRPAFRRHGDLPGQLDAVVPLENASMPGRVVVQWDKDDCADMGIVKVDLLGLGMMAVLQDALALVNGETASTQSRETRRLNELCELRELCGSRVVDLAHLPQDDPAVYAMLLRGRHDRRVPGRVARADGDAAAPEAAPVSTTSSCRWRSSGPGPIVGQMVHPYLNRRAGREPVRLSASVARADPRADARRAAVPGAAAADGDGRRRLHRRPGRRAAPRDGLQAIREADEADRGAAARGHGAAGHHRRGGASRSSRRSRRSRCTDFPSRTPPASRCSPMRARISRCITRRRSTRRCSTTSRWGSIIRRRWSRTRSGAASAFTRSTCRCRTGTARSSPTARIRLGLRYVNGLREEVGRRIAACPRLPGRPSLSPRSPQPASLRSICPKCGCDDPSMLEAVDGSRAGSATSARTTGRRSPRRLTAALRDSLARRSGRARRPAPRRARHARRHRRAQRVRLRPPLGAVAGRAARCAQRANCSRR